MAITTSEAIKDHVLPINKRFNRWHTLVSIISSLIGLSAVVYVYDSIPQIRDLRCRVNSPSDGVVVSSPIELANLTIEEHPIRSFFTGDKEEVVISFDPSKIYPPRDRDTKDPRGKKPDIQGMPVIVDEATLINAYLVNSFMGGSDAVSNRAEVRTESGQKVIGEINYTFPLDPLRRGQKHNVSVYTRIPSCTDEK